MSSNQAFRLFEDLTLECGLGSARGQPNRRRGHRDNPDRLRRPLREPSGVAYREAGAHWTSRVPHKKSGEGGRENSTHPLANVFHRNSAQRPAHADVACARRGHACAYQDWHTHKRPSCDQVKIVAKASRTPMPNQWHVLVINGQIAGYFGQSADIRTTLDVPRAAYRRQVPKIIPVTVMTALVSDEGEVMSLFIFLVFSIGEPSRTNTLLPHRGIHLSFRSSQHRMWRTCGPAISQPRRRGSSLSSGRS